jgi:hypothetical protein
MNIYSLGTTRTQLAARRIRSMRNRTEQATRSAEETTLIAGLYRQLGSTLDQPDPNDSQVQARTDRQTWGW